MQGLLGQLTRVLFMTAPRDGSGAARKATCPADRKLSAREPLGYFTNIY